MVANFPAFGASAPHPGACCRAVLFSNDKSSLNITLVALVTRRGVILVADVAQDQLLYLGLGKNHRSLVREKADEGLLQVRWPGLWGLTPIIRSEKARFVQYLMNELDGWLKNTTMEAP